MKEGSVGGMSKAVSTNPGGPANKSPIKTGTCIVH